MMKLELNQDEIIIDLVKDGALANDGDLTTSIIISLLCDARAKTDDILPEYNDGANILPPDRRGWVGDVLPDIEGDRTGSRLWLLSRAKQTEDTRQAAIEYATEALQWIIDDGHATDINITAEWVQSEYLQLLINLKTINGDARIVVPTNIGGHVYDI